MSNGYVFAWATLISWTIATFVFAKLARMADPGTLNKAVLICSTVLLGIVVCAADHLSPWQLLSLPNSSNWLWLGASGIIGKSIGDYCGYRAMRILGARRRSMITTLGPGFTWLLGLLILNENINLLGIASMLLTLISLMLLIKSGEEKEEVMKDNYGLPTDGLIFGIAGSALTSLAFILSKKTLIENNRIISEYHGTWIRILVALVTLLAFDLLTNKQVPALKPFLSWRKASLLFFGVTFSTVLGLSFSLMAIIRLNTAVAFTIFSLVPVSVTIVSVVFFRKKLSLKSWLYTLLALIGVVLLIWRDRISTL